MVRFSTWLQALTVGGLVVAPGLGQTYFNVNPRQVSLTAPAGSATPARQAVTLISGQQTVAFTAGVRYLGATTGWLSVSPLAGSTPATLTVTANASQLTAGTYLGQVTFTAASLGAYVDVLFTVGPGPGSASLVVNPSGLTFLGALGTGILPVQTLAVTTAGASGGSVGFSAFATSEGNWLSVWPPSGATPATLTVSAVQSSLVPGNYSGTITINPAAGGSPLLVPVTLAASGSGGVPDTLTLSQTALTINHQIGTWAPSLQSVRLIPSSALRQYTASTTATWIRLVSTLNQVPTMSLTDYAPGEFSVLVTPVGLSAGTYAGTIEIDSTGVPSQALPVSLTIVGTPALNVYPSSFYFDDTVGTQSSFVVVSTGGASISFAATVSAGAPWLSVTPTSGSTASGAVALAVRADPSGLTGGTYSGTITLAATDSDATFNIPVQLKIKEATAATGDLEISTDTVELAGLVGGPNPSQTVFVTNRLPGATHEFTAAASSPVGWLTAAPFRATVAPMTAAGLAITANSAAVPGPGTYNGSVVITTLLTGKQDTIPVVFTVTQQAITADPSALSFTQQRRGVAPPSQTVRIAANTVSTFSVKDVPAWVKVSPLSALTPQVLTVSVDPTGLTPGLVSGGFRVVGPNNQITVSVVLTVAEFPAPSATPTSLTFTYELGSPAPAAQSISIASTGDPIPFTVTASTESGPNWLVASPASGSTPATLTIGVNPAQLVPGKFNGSVKVSSADGSAPPRTVSIPVTITVTSPKPVIQGMLHGATLSPTPLAPGQVITITGTGLGPVAGLTGRPNAAGAFDTKLGDVRLLFDGIPAPLLFVRLDQINAIVPYLLYGRASAKVQIEAPGGSSTQIESRVIDAAPGLFTVGSSGRGQAAALNADLTLNTALNAAERGSVISLFGTGEGQTDPPGQAGRVITSDLRRPLLPATARIAGRPATVTYIGSAPGLVSGLFQVNVRIPEDIDPGGVPVEIQIGGAITQPGVTIVVR